MDGWKIVSKSEKFVCECGWESKVRKDTKKKLCKKCGAVFEKE